MVQIGWISGVMLGFEMFSEEDDLLGYIGSGLVVDLLIMRVIIFW